MDFWEIYDTYYGPVKRFLTKMSGSEWAGEDLAQDTFIKVQDGLDGLMDEARLKPWIFAIARNRCLDFFRSQAARKEDQQEDCGARFQIQPMALFQVEQQEMSDCIREKLQLLPEPLRVVLILFESVGLSQKEIADTLNITVGNVKTRLHRARKAMKEILTRECDLEYDERNVMVCVPKD